MDRLPKIDNTSKTMDDYFRRIVTRRKAMCKSDKRRCTHESFITKRKKPSVTSHSALMLEQGMRERNGLGRPHQDFWNLPAFTSKDILLVKACWAPHALCMYTGGRTTVCIPQANVCISIRGSSAVEGLSL